MSIIIFPYNEFIIKYCIRYIFEIASILGTLEFFLIQNGEELKNAGMNSYFKSLVSTVIRPTSFSEGTIFPSIETYFMYLYSIPLPTSRAYLEAKTVMLNFFYILFQYIRVAALQILLQHNFFSLFHFVAFIVGLLY